MRFSRNNFFRLINVVGLIAALPISLKPDYNCAMKPTTIHLIRHGQTDWNIQRKYQGSIDIPLNQTGLLQAKELADKLIGQRFDALYSSHLQRACQTAQVVAYAVNLPVSIDERLREIHMGDWEGRSIAELAETQAEFQELAHNDPEHYRPNGGESIKSVADRMLAALDEIARKHSGKEVLVVSHGMAIGTVLCLLQGIPFSEVGKHIPHNTVLKTIVWENKKTQP